MIIYPYIFHRKFSAILSFLKSEAQIVLELLEMCLVTRNSPIQENGLCLQVAIDWSFQWLGDVTGLRTFCSCFYQIFSLKYSCLAFFFHLPFSARDLSFWALPDTL